MIESMKFVINGGKKLQGSIAVNGFKNSATPIIAATLLTSAPCRLQNIPRVGDVLKMLAILKTMGSKQRWLSEHSIEIINDEINPEALDQKLVKQIRSSVLLIGPLLARFKKIRITTPGGCNIGSRPIDTHMEALEDLGANVELDKKSGTYEISIPQQVNSVVCLKELSVTATENLLMLGYIYPMTIHLAALEPHVFDLISFLKKIGAEIDIANGHTFQVSANQKFSGGIEHAIINDPIEAGTLALLAAATKSDIAIVGVDQDFLELPIRKLKECGVVMAWSGRTLNIQGSASVLRAAKIQTMPYPGLPTDLQAPFGVLATQANGTSLIFDTMYEGRLKYIDELKKMGADAAVLDPHRALIKGPSVLQGAEIDSLDLRAGATLIIAGLVASGKTILGNVEQIDRGYENFDERLRSLGADIKRLL